LEDTPDDPLEDTLEDTPEDTFEDTLEDTLPILFIYRKLYSLLPCTDQRSLSFLAGHFKKERQLYFLSYSAASPLTSSISRSVMTKELFSCEYQHGKTTFSLPYSAAKSLQMTLQYKKQRQISRMPATFDVHFVYNLILFEFLFFFSSFGHTISIKLRGYYKIVSTI
jgi:hypothetical protein